MFKPNKRRRPKPPPKKKAAPVSARFALYQDTEDGRNADAGWTVTDGARRIGKQHGQGDVNRGVINFHGYEEERPGPHHTTRMRLWHLVKTTALEIVEGWDLENADDDGNIVAFCKLYNMTQRGTRALPGGTLASHVVRALHSCVDFEILEHMKASGTVRDDVALNAERTNVMHNTEFPYSAARFTNFEHMSQRVAWSTKMLEKGIQLIPACVKTINDDVGRGGRRDIFE
jgi:hypothetical protein